MIAIASRKHAKTASRHVRSRVPTSLRTWAADVLACFVPDCSAVVGRNGQKNNTLVGASMMAMLGQDCHQHRHRVSRGVRKVASSLAGDDIARLPAAVKVGPEAVELSEADNGRACLLCGDDESMQLVVGGFGVKMRRLRLGLAVNRFQLELAELLGYHLTVSQDSARGFVADQLDEQLGELLVWWLLTTRFIQRNWLGHDCDPLRVGGSWLKLLLFYNKSRIFTNLCHA